MYYIRRRQQHEQKLFSPSLLIYDPRNPFLPLICSKYNTSQEVWWQKNVISRTFSLIFSRFMFFFFSNCFFQESVPAARERRAWGQQHATAATAAAAGSVAPAVATAAATATTTSPCRCRCSSLQAAGSRTGKQNKYLKRHRRIYYLLKWRETQNQVVVGWNAPFHLFSIYFQSDDDSGCALEEYSWEPPGLKPEQVRSMNAVHVLPKMFGFWRQKK